MNKRAQFFLIAAFVIVGAIIGLSTVYNTVRVQKEEKWVYDLSKEINSETAQVINQGTIIATGSENIKSNIEALSGNYSKIYPESEIAVIYGKGAEEPLAIYYPCKGGVVTIATAGYEACTRMRAPLPDSSDSLTNPNRFNRIGVDASIYLNNTLVGNFEIPSGENYFYIVIKSPRGTVASSSST
ncbi:MAG: hypothetical protein Q8L29_00075 [archaeon]|nr:hypothetical protein [archaeon]